MFRFFVFIVGIFFCFQAIAGINNYELRRLPISVGNEVTNAAGDVRQFMPTSINNAGLLAGTRLAWTPDGNGGTTGLSNQSSYIYDLETNTYVAQLIKNMAITYIGDEIYIGKRLHPNGLRWQTWRCPISGLVEDTSGAAWSNPDCVLIDNDYLDQNVAQEDWAGLFVYGTFLRTVFDMAKTSNNKGSTLVADFADNFPDGESMNYYKHDGSFMSEYDLQQLPVWGDIDGINADNLALFTSEQGRDVMYVTEWPNSPSTAGKVFRGEVSQNDFSLTVTEQIIDWMDVSSGEYVVPISVNESLDVLTTNGVCNLQDGCVNKTSFASNRTLSEGALVFYFDKKVVLSSKCINSMICNSGAYFYDISKDEETTLADMVYQKFNEELDVAVGVYDFPIFLGAKLIHPSGLMHSSRNGKYFVFTARDANVGTVRNYTMKRKN